MDLASLSQTPLFRGASPREVEQMLACLAGERRQFAKGAILCRAGDTASSLGLVLSGRVLIEHLDFWGGAAILGSAGPGEVFAESYACMPEEPMMVSVTAAETAEVLFLRMDRVLSVCPQACPCHTGLIRNLLALSARKNLELSRKILHTSAKSIRGRLLSYLSDQAARCGSRSFTIPVDRQQLASYLNVDRSAMSHELSKMRQEGLLRVTRNRFELLGDGPEP